MKSSLLLAPLAFLATLALAQPTTPSPDDDEIARRLIEASIARYAGSCPCPYSTARNGSRCGRRSAHDRPGGEAPLCFREDVSDEAIARYRAHGPGVTTRGIRVVRTGCWRTRWTAVIRRHRPRTR